MNRVTFPAFNLEFFLSPIALKIGDFSIYWYAILIVFAIILSLILMRLSKNKYNIKYEDLLEIISFTLIFGVIGARLFYVFFNLQYYLNNINQIFNIKSGGLAIFGGIIGGASAAYMVCLLKKVSFLDFCDYIAPYLALSQAIGRIGNFINVEAYGIETTTLFRMGIELASGYKEVHPCFLYEMFFCIIIFIILKKVGKRQKYKGQILNYYLILYGITRFFIEAIRSDSLILFTTKVSQIISIVIIIIGILNTYCRKRSNFID